MSQDVCEMSIKIGCVTGKYYPLVVSGSHTIKNIKEMMNKNYKLPISSIFMSFNGRKLKDEETLSSVGVRNGSTLNMVLEMRASLWGRVLMWPKEYTQYIEFIKKVKDQVCGNDPPKERILVLIEGGRDEGPYRVSHVSKESDYSDATRLDKCSTLFSPQMLKLLVLTLLVKLVEEFRMKMNIYKLRQKMRNIAQNKKKKFVEKPGLRFWSDTDKKNLSLLDGMETYERFMYVKPARTYTSIMSCYYKEINEDMVKYSNLVFRHLGKLSESKESTMTFTSEEQVWRFLFQKCRQDQSFLIRIRPPRRNLIMLRLKRWSRVKRLEMAKRVAYLVARTSVPEAEDYLKYCATLYQKTIAKLKTPRQNLTNRYYQTGYLLVEPPHQIYLRYLKYRGINKLLGDTNMKALLEKLKLDLSRKLSKKFNKDSNETYPLISRSRHSKADESKMEFYLERLFDDDLFNFDKAYLEYLERNTPEGLKQGRLYHPKVVDYFVALQMDSSLLEQAYPEHFGHSTLKESGQHMLFEGDYEQYMGSEEPEEDDFSMNEPLQGEVSLEESFFAEMSYESLAGVHEALFNDLRQRLSNQKFEEDEKPYQAKLYRKPSVDDVYLRKLWMKIFKKNLLEDYEEHIPNLSYEFIADIHEAFRTRISKTHCNPSYSMESYESLAEIHSKVLMELRSSFVEDDLYEALAEFHESMRLHISEHLHKQRLSSTIQSDIANQNLSPKPSEDSSDGSQLGDSGFSEWSSTDNVSEKSDKNTFFNSPYDNSKYSSTTETLNSNNGEPIVGAPERTISREAKLPPADDGRVKKTRCNICRRRLNITNVYTCRCGNLYCAKHIHAELHECNYDYKKYERETLRNKYPKLYVEKIKKI